MDHQTRRRRKDKERSVLGKEKDEDEQLKELSKNLGKIISTDRLGVCIRWKMCANNMSFTL